MSPEVGEIVHTKITDEKSGESVDVKMLKTQEQLIGAKRTDDKVVVLKADSYVFSLSDIGERVAGISEPISSPHP